MSNIMIIGGSSGIGRETALLLAARGDRLALVARRAEGLDSVLRSLPNGGAAHHAFPADVGDAAAVERAFAEAESALGPLDAVVYSAGSAVVAKAEETSLEDWNGVLASNLTGLFHAARSAVPRFRSRGRGHIVAVLSVAARSPFSGWSAYTAAKAGAAAFIDCLRAEVRRAGIHVTAVFPGATDTPIWDPLGSGFDRSRMMNPDQVARLIVVALSEASAGMVEEIRVAPAGGNI